MVQIEVVKVHVARQLGAWSFRFGWMTGAFAVTCFYTYMDGKYVIAAIALGGSLTAAIFDGYRSNHLVRKAKQWVAERQWEYGE